MDSELVAQLILLIGGSITGLYGLVRFVVKSLKGLSEHFLTHLEKKNGHLERVANDFNKTIANHLQESKIASEKQQGALKVLSDTMNKIIDKI
jgi:hypothetical protein